MMFKHDIIDQTILFESMHDIYNNSYKTGLFYSAYFTLFFAITWGQFHVYNIGLIVFLLCALSLIQFKLASLYKKDIKALKRIKKWQTAMFLISIGWGLTLGLSAYYFYNNNPQHLIIYTVLFMMIIFQTATVYEHNERLYQIISFPVYVSMMISLSNNPSIDSLLMAFGITVFFIFMGKMVNTHCHHFLQFKTFRQNQKHLITHLEQQKKQTLKAQQEKAYFIASANHDIRQPVHALNLFIDALAQQEQSEQNTSIILNMKKSLLVIKNYLITLLDMSRIEAKTIDVHNIPVNLKALFAEIQLNFLDLAKDQNITFKTKAINKTVYIDINIVNTVLAHLLTNAFKFSANTKVLLTAKVIQNKVCFQVWDMGKGIKPRDQATIFEDYTQFDNNEMSGKQGLGLGLSISRKMLALISGSIHVQSTLGKGSCFSVFIPLNKNHIATLSTETRRISSNQDLSNKHILVIDDDKMVLDAMSCILNTWFLEVSLATDCGSAKKILEGKIPDIVISDYRLEQDDGIEVVEQLKTYWGKEVVTLIVTGDTSAEKLKAFKDKNIHVYHKPLQAEQLHTAIKKLMTIN